jgi:hypothetical protein
VKTYVSEVLFSTVKKSTVAAVRYKIRRLLKHLQERLCKGASQ